MTNTRQRSSLFQGPPWRALLIFMVPLWLGNVIQQSYVAIDTVILGHFIGVAGISAVGSVFGLFSLLIGAMYAFTAGLSILLAQTAGAGDQGSVSRNFMNGSLISVVGAVALAIPLVLLSVPIMNLMLIPADVAPEAHIFYIVYCLGLPLTALGNFYAHAIRGLGDSRTPTVILLISGACNAGTAFLFVGVLGLGVAGAALSIQCAGATVLIISAAVLVRSHRMSLFRFPRARLDLMPQLRHGLATGTQAAGIGIGNVLLQVASNSLGTITVAAVAVGLRVEGFTLAPLAAVGIAMTTFAAQHYGAGKTDRLRVGVRQALLLALALAAAASGVVLIFAREIAAGLLGQAPPTATDLVVQYLTLSAGFYPLVAIVFVLRGSLQGVGNVRPSLYSGIAELVGKAACAALAMGGLGLTAVSLSGPASWAVALIPLTTAWIAWRRRADILGSPVGSADQKSNHAV